MITLRYHLTVLERFPATRCGLVHVTDASNGSASRELDDELSAIHRAAASRLRHHAIADIPSIAAWRRVFRGFGVDPTQHRSAPEALLRRLAKGAGFPRINALVDLGNAVSMRYAIAVAVFDSARIVGTIAVRPANGTETFVGIGSRAPEHPEPGEIVFVDDADTILARRWCWRQSASAAVDDHTSDALFVIEGHHPTADDDIAAAARELEALIRHHLAPATITHITV